MPWKGKTSSETLNAQGGPYRYFNPYKKKEPKYYKNYFKIGYQEYRHLGKTIRKDLYIDVSESFIGIILGMRGSGKTFLERRFLDLAINSGFACFIPFDIKNEIISSREPASTKYSKLLASLEEPRGANIRAFYPSYLGDAPKHNEFFQISFEDMNYSDLMTIFKRSASVAENSAAQAGALMYLFDLIRDGRIVDWETFIEELDIAEEIMPATKRTIKLTAQTLMRNHVVGDDYPLDVVEVLNSGATLVLDLLDYEDMGINLASSYAAILMRKIMAARRQRLITKPMFWLLDEAHEFCSEKKQLSSTEETIGCANKSRSWGISMLIATQNLEELPQRIVNQAQYKFLPQNISFDVLKQTLKSSSMLEWDRDSYNEAISLHRSLKRKSNGEREWLMIDVVSKESTAFFPYGPMSMHQTEHRF